MLWGRNIPQEGPPWRHSSLYAKLALLCQEAGTGAHPAAPDYLSSAGQVTSNGTMTESLSKPESCVTSWLAVASKQLSWWAQPEAFSSPIFLGCTPDWQVIETARASRVCLLCSSQVSTLGNNAGSVLRIFQLSLSHSVTWYPSSLWKPS